MVNLQKKTKQLIWLSIIVAAITIAGTIIIYFSQITTITLPYDYAITPYVSINAGTDTLHFGGGKAGSILQRTLILTTNTTTRMSIQTDQSYIYTEENMFTLTAGERRELPIYLVIPNDLPSGNYTGTIIITERK